eukprot:NODE_13_length_42895_cov_0.518413.p25 type:complete len:115 gc:universal NODE_13_length_42895_cov_0.518413:21608-21952(+)
MFFRRSFVFIKNNKSWVNFMYILLLMPCLLTSIIGRVIECTSDLTVLLNGCFWLNRIDLISISQNMKEQLNMDSNASAIEGTVRICTPISFKVSYGSLSLNKTSHKIKGYNLKY